MKRSGLIVYSFALSENEEKEPNPCNFRLAKEVERIKKENNGIVIVAQWEVDIALKQLGILSNFVVKRQGEAYLDSEEVTRQAAEFFRKIGIKEIIPVAQLLHLKKCVFLIKKMGLIPIRKKIGWIGFYKHSLQWWTRGPIRLCIYAILQVLFRR